MWDMINLCADSALQTVPVLHQFCFVMDHMEVPCVIFDEAFHLVCQQGVSLLISSNY